MWKEGPAQDPRAQPTLGRSLGQCPEGLCVLASFLTKPYIQVSEGK